MRRFIKESRTISAKQSSLDANNDTNIIPNLPINDDDNNHEKIHEISAEASIEESNSSNYNSRRSRKKQEQSEIQAIMEEEGYNDEEDGEQADELEKLSGNPLAEDCLLYAVPMCGPYSSMQNFKYRVKLTPGTMKKGKAVKQAVDTFARAKDCTNTEKPLIRGMSDPEMVAIMIADVKLSMPGLYAAQKQNSKQKKGKK